LETWIEIGLIWGVAFVAMGVLARYAWVRTVPGQKIEDDAIKLRGFAAPRLPRAWSLSSAPALGAILGIVLNAGSKTKGGDLTANLIFAGVAIAFQAWTALSVGDIRKETADEFT